MRGTPRPVYLADIGHVRPDTWLSLASRKAWDTALRRCKAWDTNERSPALSAAWFVRYKTHLLGEGLAPRTVNLYLTVIRSLVAAAYQLELVPLQLVAELERVKNVPNHTVTPGRWLDLEHVERLVAAPGTSTLRGCRDTAILSLLAGAGLRRSEISTLRAEWFVQVHGRTVIESLPGKHNRTRHVPVPGWAVEAVDLWTARAGIRAGWLFRPIHSTGALMPGPMTSQVTYRTVRDHARAAGLSARPHDLRRTFARLAYTHGAPIDQLQMTLGHASMATTEVYLGLKQNLQDAPADLIPIRWSA